MRMPSPQHVQVSDGKPGGEAKDFDFDRAYWSHDPKDESFASQQTLMDELGNELLESALHGFNNCLFAYGQTGSGKTFSVLGSEEPPELRGLIPRVIEELFSRIEKAHADPALGVKFRCKVSYIEIYNEHLHDLLIPVGQRGESKLEIHVHPKLGVVIPGLTENAVQGYQEVKRLIDFGSSRAWRKEGTGVGRLRRRWRWYPLAEAVCRCSCRRLRRMMCRRSTCCVG